MIENEDVNLQSYVFAWTDCDWQGDLCQSGFPLSAQAVPSQPVKSPNIVSKRSSRSNRWKPILVEAGLPGQIGSVLSTRAVRGKYRLRTQEGQKGQKAASSASVTDVHRLWVSLHRFGISDFRFGISDFEIRISELGFQCLAGNHCHKLANFCLGVKGDFGGAGGLAEG